MKLIANDEQLRWYWMGKRPNSRKAVMWYIQHPRETEGYLTQIRLGKIFGITEVTIRNHLREMQKNGLISGWKSAKKKDYTQAKKMLVNQYPEIEQILHSLPLSKDVQFYLLKSK